MQQLVRFCSLPLCHGFTFPLPGSIAQVGWNLFHSATKPCCSTRHTANVKASTCLGCHEKYLDMRWLWNVKYRGCCWLPRAMTTWKRHLSWVEFSWPTNLGSMQLRHIPKSPSCTLSSLTTTVFPDAVMARWVESPTFQINVVYMWHTHHLQDWIPFTWKRDNIFWPYILYIVGEPKETFTPPYMCPLSQNDMGVHHTGNSCCAWCSLFEIRTWFSMAAFTSHGNQWETGPAHACPYIAQFRRTTTAQQYTICWNASVYLGAPKTKAINLAWSTDSGNDDVMSPISYIYDWNMPGENASPICDIRESRPFR